MNTHTHKDTRKHAITAELIGLVWVQQVQSVGEGAETHKTTSLNSGYTTEVYYHKCANSGCEKFILLAVTTKLPLVILGYWGVR